MLSSLVQCQLVFDITFSIVISRYIVSNTINASIYKFVEGPACTWSEKILLCIRMHPIKD